MNMPKEGICCADSVHNILNEMEDTEHNGLSEDFYFNYDPDPSDMLITAEVLSSIRKRFLSSGIDASILQQHEQFGMKAKTLYDMKANFNKSSIFAVDKHFPMTQFPSNVDKLVNSECNLVPSFEDYTDNNSVFSPCVKLEHDCVSPTSGQASPDSSMLSSTFLTIHKDDNSDTNSGSYSGSPIEYSCNSGSRPSHEFVFPIDKSAVTLKKTPAKPGHILPPCRVCGDKASGFHYGANTCEACKGFFRRSLKKETIEYKCGGNHQCTIQKGRRNNCALCRYNKCLSIGMSKTAIKTGRYTHEKRTKDIVEVKQLSGDFIPLMSQCKTEHDISTIKSPLVKRPEDEKLLARIYSAHKLLFPFWHKIQEAGVLQMNMINYAEKFKLKKPMVKLEVPFGIDDVAHIKKEEDIGNPLSTIKLVTDHMELAITVFVKFAKVIPGFCDLMLNDQASLVKLSRFEVWMVGAHKFFNPELNIVSGPRGNSYHREELVEVIDSDFVDAMFSFSKALQVVELSNEETALLQCVVMTFSDRSALHEPDKIDTIQQRLVCCLEALVSSVRRFSQIMSALVNLRELTEQHERVSEKILMNWPTIQRYPLLLEVMAV